MRVVAYLRVSTDRQAEAGLGLEVQEAALRRWARTQGHRVIDWHRDEGVSGSNGLEQREALPDALAAIRSGLAQGLVVYRLDRLARDLVVQETLLAEVRRMGGEVLSTAPSEADYLRDDPDDPTRKLIRQILGAVNEYDRAMIGVRLRAGRRMKAEKGGYAYGSPPVGYRAEAKELVVEETESRAVARARELREQGESLRAIARILDEEGHHAKRGGPWHPATLARALSRPAPV